MIIRKDKLGLDATRTPSDLDIAWAAGIYEGEGSCVRGGNGNRSFAVSVCQKDPELLYRLRDLFGGSVRQYANDRGTLANGNQAFMIYAWRVCGDRARVFVAVIYGYLTTRRKAQIDATPIRVFLDTVGIVPKEGAFSFASSAVSSHVERQIALREEKRKNYQKKFYDDRKADPKFMETRREQTQQWRKREKVVAIA